MGGDRGNVTVNQAISSTTGNITASGINFTSNSGGGNNGTITTTGGNVQLDFTRDITTNAAITLGGSGSLTLNAGRDIGINRDITLDGGSFTADAGGTIYIGDDIDAGNITLKDNVILDGTGGSPSYNRNQDILADNTLCAGHYNQEQPGQRNT